MLSDVPDGGSGPKRNPFGRGLLPRGWSSNGTVDVASAGSVGRRPRPCGGVATICHIHDTTSSGRCGRGRGSSSPARKRVTKVDRQGVAAGDCSPVTASASRLAERGLRSARSRCPTSSRSALELESSKQRLLLPRETGSGSAIAAAVSRLYGSPGRVTAAGRSDRQSGATLTVCRRAAVYHRVARGAFAVLYVRCVATSPASVVSRPIAGRRASARGFLEFVRA